MNNPVDWDHIVILNFGDLLSMRVFPAMMMAPLMLLAGCASDEFEEVRLVACPEGRVLKGADRTMAIGVEATISFAETACVREDDQVLAAIRAEITTRNPGADAVGLRLPAFIITVTNDDDVRDRRVLGYEVNAKPGRHVTYQVTEGFVFPDDNAVRQITIMTGFMEPALAQNQK